MSEPILPGGAIGVFGGGQLGRMLALEAIRHGYDVHVFAPEPDGPASQAAQRTTAAPYGDLDAVARFASSVDVVTLEFENVPPEALAAAARHAPVRPSPEALATTRHRLREKRFLRGHGHPVAPFLEPGSVELLPAALDELGGRAVLKTATLGYDGKGQLLLDAADPDLDAAARLMAMGETVLERFVPIALELSIVAARGVDGAIVSYPAFENRHHRHILDVTVTPARVPSAVAERARVAAEAILEQLDLVGTACVEMFLTERGELLINEIAPRPHNSGHLTFGAAPVSQFAQQLRAVCGLPLGEAAVPWPTAMANLLGDLWSAGEPDWRRLLGTDAALHLYGKAEARPGRKMGHLVAIGASVDDAEATVLAAREALGPARSGE